MKKTIKNTGLILIILICMGSTVLAEPLSDKLKGQQDKLRKDKSSLQNVQNQLDSLEQNMEMMDDKIGSLTNDVNKNKKLITSTEEDIHKAEKEIQNSQENLKKSNDLFSKRVRAMYINGSKGYLELLLDSKGISDLLSRMEFIATMVSYDKKMVSDIKTKQEEVSKTKETLQIKEQQLIALNEDNRNKILKLKSDKENQSKLVAEAKKNEQVLAANVSDSQAQVNATLQQIAEIRKVETSTTLSRGGSTISTNSVIAYATNFLGTPYVWGGTSPVPGFDCSGFTQYVYAHFGVKLGRTTYEQIKNGAAVSRDALQPGDLVFFGTWSNPHHMGIYVGNNTYIHAPHTGDVIKISSMSRSDFVTGRRVR